MPKTIQSFFSKKRIIWLCVGVLLFSAVILFQPLHTSIRQAVILGTLLFVLVCWTSGCLPKWIAALVMLAVFSLLGSTPLKTVFQFPLSTNFIFIFFSFLFSQGIVNSGLIPRLLFPFLKKRIRSVRQYVLLVALCVTVMIFVIPQPFVRVILIASIFGQYLDCFSLEKEKKEILMFFVYCLSCTANMLFLRGDVVMNYAVLSFGEIDLTSWQWLRMMFVPTAVLLILQQYLLQKMYSKELKDVELLNSDTVSYERLNRFQTVSLILILLTVLVMSTELLHGIPAWITIIVGTVIMFPLKILKLPDFKKVNYELLVFFTAAFSIGPVMKNSGVAEIIFSRFSVLLPEQFGWKFLLVVVILTMVLHMVLGSAVSTTSVVVPGLLFIVGSAVSNVALVAAIYVAVYSHFLLPIHNVVLLIGNKDYSSSLVSKTGIVYTVLIPVFILLVYYPWWRWMGIFA